MLSDQIVLTNADGARTIEELLRLRCSGAGLAYLNPSDLREYSSDELLGELLAGRLQYTTSLVALGDGSGGDAELGLSRSSLTVCAALEQAEARCQQRGQSTSTFTST